MSALPWHRDDGGRADAGYRGRTGDCVTRAIAIATGADYQTVYDALHQGALQDRGHMAWLELEYGQHARRHASPRDGVSPKVYRRYLEQQLGWAWTPTMAIGTGCQVHLRQGELPGGRLVVRLSKHVCAVLDGVVHDTYDPCRDGTRCVYGYWSAP